MPIALFVGDIGSRRRADIYNDVMVPLWNLAQAHGVPTVADPPPFFADWDGLNRASLAVEAAWLDTRQVAWDLKDAFGTSVNGNFDTFMDTWNKARQVSNKIDNAASSFSGAQPGVGGSAGPATDPSSGYLDALLATGVLYGDDASGYLNNNGGGTDYSDYLGPTSNGGGGGGGGGDGGGAGLFFALIALALLS